jgi:hypothetical protein
MILEVHEVLDSMILACSNMISWKHRFFLFSMKVQSIHCIGTTGVCLALYADMYQMEWKKLYNLGSNPTFAYS